MASGAALRTEPIYQLGAKSLSVPMQLHTTNRQRLCARLQQRWEALRKEGRSPTEGLAGVYVLLQGGSELWRGDSDSSYVFRQESFFHWTFGGLEPDCYGAVEVSTSRAILFIPRTSDETAIYDGMPASPEEMTIKYAVDETHFVDEMPECFKKWKTTLILTLHGLNTDSGRFTMEAKFPGINDFLVNNQLLHPEMVHCRLFKTPAELDVMRYANRVSSAAHRQVMRIIKSGMYEYQLESVFLNHCYYHGAMRNCSYTCIAASGHNCATLHYGHAGSPNERLLEDGDMCLFDMGGEYYCYTSDITCSFPVNGRFTPDQRMVYEAVLAASQAVLAAVRPGASWLDLHLLAEKQILSHLLKAGLLKGRLEDMMSARLPAVFMPHGLGHLMGCDVHDVGGYEEDAPPRSSLIGLRNLRTTRVLQPNMVVTVEPGCYFIDRLLDAAYADPQLRRFLVREKLERFRKFGGVRIEDNIVVTESGHELLTDVPRTVEEIEKWMAGGADTSSSSA